VDRGLYDFKFNDMNGQKTQNELSIGGGGICH
jgi:hypothetical protein